jgi:hypothetical protein
MGGVKMIQRRKRVAASCAEAAISKYYFQPVDLVINFLILSTVKSEREPNGQRFEQFLFALLIIQS